MNYVLDDILSNDIKFKGEALAPDKQVSGHLLGKIHP